MDNLERELKAYNAKIINEICSSCGTNSDNQTACCHRIAKLEEVNRIMIAALEFRIRAYEDYPPGGMSKGEYHTIQQIVVKANELMEKENHV